MRHAPAPYTTVEIGANASGGFHSYVADCDGRKIAAIWGKADEKAWTAALFAAAPELFKHARSLLNGIDTGLVRIDTDADETLANTIGGLRAAVAKVEGRS